MARWRVMASLIPHNSMSWQKWKCILSGGYMDNACVRKQDTFLLKRTTLLFIQLEALFCHTLWGTLLNVICVSWSVLADHPHDFPVIANQLWSILSMYLVAFLCIWGLCGYPQSLQGVSLAHSVFQGCIFHQVWGSKCGLAPPLGHSFGVMFCGFAHALAAHVRHACFYGYPGWDLEAKCLKSDVLSPLLLVL